MAGFIGKFWDKRKKSEEAEGKKPPKSPNLGTGGAGQAADSIKKRQQATKDILKDM